LRSGAFVAVAKGGHHPVCTGCRLVRPSGIVDGRQVYVTASRYQVPHAQISTRAEDVAFYAIDARFLFDEVLEDLAVETRRRAAFLPFILSISLGITAAEAVLNVDAFALALFCDASPSQQDVVCVAVFFAHLFNFAFSLVCSAA